MYIICIYIYICICACAYVHTYMYIHEQKPTYGYCERFAPPPTLHRLELGLQEP